MGNMHTGSNTHEVVCQVARRVTKAYQEHSLTLVQLGSSRISVKSYSTRRQTHLLNALECIISPPNLSRPSKSGM